MRCPFSLDFLKFNLRAEKVKRSPPQGDTEILSIVWMKLFFTAVNVEVERLKRDSYQLEMIIIL